VRHTGIGINSARKKETERLEHLTRTLRAHNRSNQALILAADEAAYLEEVCRIIVEDCGQAMVWVGFKEEDEAKTVRPVAHSGFDEGYLETLQVSWAENERGRGPTGAAIRTGRACTCRNMLTDPLFLPWRENAIERGYASSIALPLLAGDKVIGALTIYSREPDPFSESEVNLLTELASDFAYGINVLRLKAAHALAERTLQESEQRYRSLVEMSPDAILVNHENRIIQANGSALRLLRADSPDQVLGKSPFEIFHPDYHELIRERMRCVLGGDSVSPIEEKIVRLDGSTCDVEVAASRCREREGFALQVILRDITERKAAQEALRQSEERVRLKLESILSPGGDIGDLELRDIIDARAIQSLLDDFFAVAHIPLAIVDLKGDVLVGVGWKDICTKFHRVHPDTRTHCIESDTQLSAGVAPGEFRLYRCKNKMWDMSTPLTIGGRHLGNMFSGQFFFEDELIDYESFRSQAEEYGFDERAYMSALDDVPRLSGKSVDAAMTFLLKLGNTVSDLSYSNIKLARSLAERDELMDSLKKSEIRERARAAELEAIMDAAPVAMVIARDPECRTLAGSRMTYELLRMPPGSNLASEGPAHYRIMKDGVEISLEDLASHVAARTGKPVENYEFDLVFEDGASKRLLGNAVPLLDDAGKSRGSVAGFLDVTERKRMEQRLRESQKLESVGLLAGGIAHDFNNLLVGVVGNASLAEDMLPPGNPAVEILRRIVNAGERAAHLTRQMLAYAGKGRFILEPVDLSGLVSETIPLIQSSISTKIAFRIQTESGMPAIESDPSQMQQVFMNLALNAGEAIGDNPGAISISTGGMMVDAAYVADNLEGWEIEPGEYAFLEVRDTGCGMDAATKAKIFDPFFTTKFTGRGLGLAAVAGIVRAHRGAIKLTTAPGAGSTFRVLFPAMTSGAVEIEVPVERNDDLRGAGTVLVVDDERIVRDLAKHSLERHGYEVLVAESGPEAIEAVRSQGNRIQLVVLDLSMPGMGGEEALPQLRQLDPNLEVIISSGYSQAEALRLFRGLRVSGFIQKPYTVKDLTREVKSVLASRRFDA
jgi:PAS domain S-box-containing protein